MHKKILRIAVPSIISNITIPLLSLADLTITGHLGSEVYIGAIAVGGMLFNVFYWLFAFLRMGTSGLTAQALGRRDFKSIMHLLVQNTSFALFISIVLMLLSSNVLDVALWIISPDTEIIEHTRTYYNILIFGATPSLILSALNGWLIGMQNSRIPMFVAIVQNLLNIILSLFFVLRMNMTIDGVALGTLISQWAGLLLSLLLLYVYFGRLRKYFTWKGIFQRDKIIKLFNVNNDIFFRTLCMIIVHFSFVSAGARFGTVALAVNTILMQLFVLFSYFMDGFAFAGEAVAGKVIGGGNKGALRKLIHSLFLWGTGITLLFSIIYGFWGRETLSFITDNNVIVSEAMNYQHWTLLIPLCGMSAFLWDGIFVGAAKTRPMLYSTLAGMLSFCSLYFILTPLIGNHGLWIAYLTYLAIRGIILTFKSKTLYTFV